MGMDSNSMKTWHAVSGELSSKLLKPGKWNLLTVWALDCAICEKQKPALSHFHEKFPQLEVTGLSIDGLAQIDAVRQRLLEKPVSFANHLIDYRELARHFNKEFRTPFIGTPTYIFYSPEGKLLEVHAGPMDFTKLQKILNSNSTNKPAVDLMR